jgi:DNA-binding MarR family transcriptional regulator
MSDRTATRRADFEGKAREAATSAASKPAASKPAASKAAAPKASAPRISAPKRRNGAGLLSLGVLDGHLGYYLRRAQIWIFQDFIRTLEGLDLRPAEFSVLAVIGGNKGLSQADVAQRLGIERARLVRLLDRLEKRGFTQRLPSPTDRRSHVLRLTPSGQQMLKRAKALVMVHEGRLIERLGPAPHKMMIDALRDFDR